MKRKQLVIGLVLITAALTAARAGADDLKDLPGYVDLEWIRIPDDAEEIQDIDLGVVLLGIAADAEENRDEALLQALSMIKSIRVKSWSLDGDDAMAREAVARITDRLADDDWKHMIRFKDKDETVTVSTRHQGQDMVGLMLVTYEPGDMVTFVNVVGDLDLGALFKLVKEFDEDSLEDILEELDEVEGVEINRR